MIDALTAATYDGSDEFPILRELDFFNHAGVAPISGRAAAAIAAYGRQAATRAYVEAGWWKRVEDIRALAARFIGAAGPQEIAFVPNTSAGLALVARGLDWREGDEVVITNVEYPANRYPWEDLKRLGVKMIEVRQLPDGRIDVQDVIDAITDRTRVVSLSQVQYASGYRIDLRPISDAVHQAGGYLCVDAIQSLGAMPVDVAALGIDFLAADGHKWLLSPEGAGIFYCRGDLVELLHPAVIGWRNMIDAEDYGNYRFKLLPDARRFEPGSHNVAGLLALGASMELLLGVGLETVWSRIEALTRQLCEALAAAGHRVFSPRREPGECSGIVSFEPRSDTGDARAIAGRLQQQGVIVAVREGRLRASPHFYMNEAQVERLLAALP
jgi:cysteine desulfurase / selenocysteine lyase